MSQSTPTALLPGPRVVVVMAGASSPVGTPSTALELARMPQLRILAHAGRVGRLRTVAEHLPASETTAAAALLGTVPPVALDPGAVAAEALGRMLATGECCTVVDVVDHHGHPAPALDVQRAETALRQQLPRHRIVGVSHGHQILVAGAARPLLPQLEGLDLHPAVHGFLPARQLDGSTVVVAEEGSTLLGVASLLGAHTEAVDPMRSGRRDPVPGRLRSRALQAVLGGARTLVIESRAPVDARRGPRDAALRGRALVGALEMLDRELVGPLRTASAWTGACLAVTTDLPRGLGGVPERGEVPIVMAGPRSVFVPESAPLVPQPGTSLPPTYSERAVEAAPVVASPFTLLPPAAAVGPRRFQRDPVTGRTHAAEIAVG